MPEAKVNGIRLYYELAGNGEPVVLIHGSWGDSQGWGSAVPLLAGSFRVLAYDRRGHSRSEGSDHPGSIEEDAADAAALLEALDLAPAHLVGSSLGGIVVLRLALRRSDLLRSLAIHEPPLLGLLDGVETVREERDRVRKSIRAVAARIEAGDAEAGARQFVEELGLGPGAWDRLSASARQTMLRNAPTFLDEARDPDAFVLDLPALSNFDRPALLTQGEASLPFYGAILDRLAAEGLPGARRHTFRGAGHVPHSTHSQEFAAVLTRFVTGSRRSN